MKNNKLKKAFTLIELLVVVAIIGILASVVLASLSNARDQGKQAAIKSNLKNMIPQTEISYSSVNPNNYSTACAGVSGMLAGINNSGGTSACYSFDNSSWGAAGKFNTSTFQAWGADSSGLVSWDAQGVNTSGAFVGSDVSMTQAQAAAACIISGGRLPTLDQLMALSIAYGSVTPPSFLSSIYWTSNAHAPTPGFYYFVTMSNGTYNNTAGNPGPGAPRARCVR